MVFIKYFEKSRFFSLFNVRKFTNACHMINIIGWSEIKFEKFYFYKGDTLSIIPKEIYNYFVSIFFLRMYVWFYHTYTFRKKNYLLSVKNKQFFPILYKYVLCTIYYTLWLYNITLVHLTYKRFFRAATTNSTKYKHVWICVGKA